MNYDSIFRPLLFKLPPELAHEIGIGALRLGLGSDSKYDDASERSASEAFGEIKRFGIEFRNPLGIAAGFDKNGVVVNQLSALGFGFVEVGTVTFDPQKGNDRPRLFRLPADNAIVNRLGFNNEGAEAITARLEALSPECVLGVNIGKNKNVPNEEAIGNYLKSFNLVHTVADYVAVNVSSPNTPDLRELQKAENLEDLLKALQERNSILSPAFRRLNAGVRPPQGGTHNDVPPEGETSKGVPLLVKIAPDLTEPDIEAVVDICLRYNIAGIIATNTTTGREGLKTQNVERFGEGGLSGGPLAARSNEVVSSIYRYSMGKLPVIGVGGIFTPQDAFAKIAAGACLLQAYTGFVYHGPSFAREINIGLARILKEKGFRSLDDAVGSASN